MRDFPYRQNSCPDVLAFASVKEVGEDISFYLTIQNLKISNRLFPLKIRIIKPQAI